MLLPRQLSGPELSLNVGVSSSAQSVSRKITESDLLEAVSVHTGMHAHTHRALICGSDLTIAGKCKG